MTQIAAELKSRQNESAGIINDLICECHVHATTAQQQGRWATHGLVAERRAHVVLLPFHLLDCYAGLRNLDAALEHVRLFAGRGKETRPPPAVSAASCSVAFRGQRTAEKFAQTLRFKPRFRFKFDPRKTFWKENDEEERKDKKDNACRNVLDREQNDPVENVHHLFTKITLQRFFFSLICVLLCSFCNI